MPKTKKLTGKQKRFAQEYMIDQNATQAAIRAGYSMKSARISGSDNMSNYEVKRLIARKQEGLAEKVEMTLEKMHKQYDEDREFARSVKAAGAAVTASISTARLYGMDKDAGARDTEQQRELTESEQAEARRIASIRLRSG